MTNLRQLFEQYCLFQKNLENASASLAAQRKTLGELEISVAGVQTKTSEAETALRDAMLAEFTSRKSALAALEKQVSEGNLLDAYALFSVAKLLDMSNLVEYNGLLWEVKTERDADGNKVWKRYDIAVQELAKKGLHLPTLQEQGALHLASLEGKLDGPIKDIARTLDGEWIKGGCGHDKGQFVYCPDATFVWNGTYVLQDRGQRENRVPAQKIGIGWNFIRDLGNSVSQLVYQRDGKELHQDLQVGIGFYLGKEGELQPVGRRYYGSVYVGWAVRGVAPVM